MTGWSPPALPAQWTWAAELPPWVGRQRELEQLERAWEAVEHGARQVVLVGGEPGAGKSRLVMEVASALSRQGVPVLVGQCTSDLGLPFDPLVAPIRALMSAIAQGELEFPEAEDAEQANRLLAQLTAGVAPEESSVSLPAMALGAVVSALSSACATGPLVVVLEDLHWAGESALRGLRHIIERTSDLPLLVLGTHRDRPPDVSDSLSSIAAEVLRIPGAHRVSLAGFRTSEVASYLTALNAGAPAVIERTSPVLRARTGGNPFLLGEVWREVRNQGGLDRLVAEQVTVPETLQSMVHTRLRKLRPADQRLVEVGAVIGESFDLNLVHVAGGSDSIEDTFGGAGAAAAAGLVRAVPDNLGTYAFPHALARQAVLAEMEPYAVSSTHAAIARALEEGDTRDPERIRALAHHYSMATGLGHEARAVHYLAAAAGVAVARMAYSDAGALLGRAADLTPEMDARDQFRLRAAQSYVRAGRFDRAWPLGEAVATSAASGVRLEAALCLEAISWRNRTGAARAVELLGAALREYSPDADDPARIRATAALGRELTSTGRFAEGESMMNRALDVAREQGDSQLLLAVLDLAIVEALGVRGDHGAERLLRIQRRAIEASRLARAAGDLDKLGNASQSTHIVSYVLGDATSLTVSLDALDQVATVTQNAFWQYRSQVLWASRHLVRGDLESAQTSVKEARRVALSVGHSPELLDGPLSMQTFAYRRESGGLEFARAMLAGPQVVRYPWPPGMVAMYRELEMADPARAELRRTLAEDLDELRASETWPASLALLGDAAVWLADRPAAEVLLAEAEPLSGLNLSAAELLAPFGSAERLIGGLKSVLGDATAEEHFAAALEMDLSMDAPLHVATTHAEWADHLRRSGAPQGAIAEHVRAARRLADRHDLVRVLRLLRGAGPRKAEPPAGLTARELEVLRLVGRGHGNREIARSLFISEHTAANHVRSILAKTQVTNRTAAARYAQVHGLLADDVGAQ